MPSSVQPQAGSLASNGVVSSLTSSSFRRSMTSLMYDSIFRAASWGSILVMLMLKPSRFLKMYRQPPSDLTVLASLGLRTVIRRISRIDQEGKNLKVTVTTTAARQGVPCWIWARRSPSRSRVACLPVGFRMHSRALPQQDCLTTGNHLVVGAPSTCCSRGLGTWRT